MLNVGKLAAGPGAGRYYVDQVAQGREDYYAGEGEAPGTWLGAGAASLGLSGEVSEEGIVRLLEARDPGNGESLLRPLASGAIAGFDLTFRAPKSVGVLFAVSEPQVVREIVGAHEAAVEQAMAYMEREACRARRGHGGAIVVEGRGFVAAAFRHRASRAGDPLLHTHVVVANMTQTADGRWTALDGRPLYRHAKTAGYLYREWGYTALSRHRHEARFYVSATPTFLNEAPAPLQAGDDFPFRLTRMLETSRAKHLASCGVHRGRDPLAAPERGPDPLAAPESELMVGRGHGIELDFGP